MESAWFGALSTVFVVALAVGLGIVLCAVAAPDLLGRVTWARVRFVRCPSRDTGMTVEFQEDVVTGRAVDVRWCTAFTPAAAVRCGRQCVEEAAAARGRRPLRTRPG